MVFYISISFILLFLIFGFLFPEQLLAATSQLFGVITNDLGWFYLVTVLGILAFSLYLAFSRFGKIRLLCFS